MMPPLATHLNYYIEVVVLPGTIGVESSTQ
jgi:hypothetical protein